MFYEQLNKACKENGTSVTAVLKKIGVGTANGTFWKNGSVPSSDIVVKLSEFLNVSTDYLLTGKEKSSPPELTEDERKLLENYNNLTSEDRARIQERAETLLEVRTAEKPNPKPRRIQTQRTRKIDLYDTPVSAGTGVYLDDGSKRKIKIVVTPESEKADFALRVTGDSMEPDFSDGDIVLVRDIGAVDIGQIGVFMVDNQGYIKLFRENRLCSLNENYEDIQLTEYTEGRCCGPVIGKLDEDEIIEM